LVVDDSRVARRLIKLLLEDSGEFEVVGECADGQDGLVKARELQPDVITLDLDMPHYTGLDMLHALRRESGVPVVVVSGMPTSIGDLAREAAALGIRETVMKAFSDHPLDLSLFADELAKKVYRAWATTSGSPTPS